MRRAKGKDFYGRILDNPIAVIILSVLAMAMGLFFIISQNENTPVPREEAVAYTGDFDYYDTEWENYRYIYFTDGTGYSVYPHTETQAFRQKMEALEKGTHLYLLINPNNDCVAEIRTETEELLNFEQSQQEIASYDNGYVWLGGFCCVGSVFLVIYTIASTANKRKETARHTQRKERAAHQPILRHADSCIKSKILLEKTIQGYHICYRRVKTVNELVINGQVYDEKKALIEFEHSLVATVDGHTFEAGLDSESYSYILFNKTLICRKKRWI